MSRTDTDSVKVNVYLNRQVLDAIKRLALRRGCAYSELLRDACREYVLTKGREILAEERALKEMNQ
jgi:hypothetical protein